MIHLPEFSLVADPEQLQQCFLGWIQSISQLTDGEIVSIDGKTLRHSYDKNSDQERDSHG